MTGDGDRFSGWAIVELFGHRRLAGRVEDVEAFGGRMLRLDVFEDGHALARATQFYGPGAIYCVTPTTEEVARAFARGSEPLAVREWELRPPPGLARGDDDDRDREPIDEEIPF